MKFIYCLNEDVSKDLEAAGLVKVGKTVINGQVVDIYENSKEIYLNRYQKNEIVLSNKLCFAPFEHL